ncbi:hypothetical protein [Psychrobacillus antarcticus]|uniref:hypothetical protein n=1 Tax=Psychrobacillus antarcticus TaxID=2879115 RepID=UPI002A4E1B61|nr:hypothetical protein [Psychrobacillus antarcticus]
MKQQFMSSFWQIRVAAMFGLIGAAMCAHMAGAGSYQLRPIHAHILVVGWLNLFSWGVYNHLSHILTHKFAALHVFKTLIGAIGLTNSM